jgi:nicotinamide riboside kinase
MVVMYIWSMVVYGKVSSYIQEELKKQQFDLYILCDTDVPWTYDPLRENEFDRDDLFERYYKKLRELKYNFIIVKGSPEQRLQQAVEMIDKMGSETPNRSEESTLIHVYSNSLRIIATGFLVVDCN